MAKRYYWLKLKDDFFDGDTLRYIEEQENGFIYSNFYLKLCLKSLKSDGILMRLVGTRMIPHDVASLAKLTNVPEERLPLRCSCLKRSDWLRDRKRVKLCFRRSMR